VSHTSTVVIIGMVSIGLAGYLSALVIGWIEQRLAPWRY
jgi:NitT/TauT family transport system permease protein